MAYTWLGQHDSGRRRSMLPIAATMSYLGSTELFHPRFPYSTLGHALIDSLIRMLCDTEYSLGNLGSWPCPV